MHTIITGAALALTLGIALPAHAAGEHKHDHKHAHGAPKLENIGRSGDPANVGRIVEIVMRDSTFEPSSLEIGQGETVRFVVTNAGELVHEFNIATAAMHGAHQAEMQVMMDKGILEADRIRHDLMGHGDHGMRHDHANSVLLEPGKTGEMVWTFDTDTRLEFACNVPGHYEAGMVGHIRLSD